MTTIARWQIVAVALAALMIGMYTGRTDASMASYGAGLEQCAAAHQKGQS